MSPAVDVRIEARGLLCPQPVLLLARAARSLPPGGTIALVADDPAALTDVPAWCRLRSAELVEMVPLGAATRYVVRVGSSATTGTPSTSP